MVAKTEDSARLAFMLFDRDGDGKLIYNDALTCVRSLGLVAEASELSEWPDLVSLDEFLKGYTKLLSKGDPTEAMLSLFKKFDTKGKGSISTEEMIQVIRTLGQGIGERELKDIALLADPENSGNTLYKEFIKRLLD